MYVNVMASIKLKKLKKENSPMTRNYTVIITLTNKKYISIARHKKLLCFSGIAHITFNPRMRICHCISSIHIEKLSIHRKLSV